MKKPFTLIQLNTVDSTNRYLKEWAAKERPSDIVFCITQQQTAGYGQQNRTWQTNTQSAIFSLAYPLDPKVNLPGLVSLHIACLLHQCLTQLTGDTLWLKWPNDLYNQHGKVAGILIEQVIKKDYRALIIGIGINRNQTGLIESASSVSEFDTEALINLLYQKTQSPGLLNFSIMDLFEYWKQHDLFLINEPIQRITAENQDSAEEAIYLGINPTGQALIKVAGKTQTLTSGQTSIRKKNMIPSV